MFNLFKKKENVEITVIDDNEQLPDIRKIAIPDLKQYLLKGYEEIREVKQEKEELKEKLENALQYKELYEASLVINFEFETRDKENKEKIEKLESKLNSALNDNYNLKEQLNEYKIRENELQEKEDNINTLKLLAIENAIKEYNNRLIDEIEKLKGNISKSKLVNLIRDFK